MWLSKVQWYRATYLDAKTRAHVLGTDFVAFPGSSAASSRRAAASPKVGLQRGPRSSSLRRHLRRHVDPACRSFPKRMRFKIDPREQRHIGGADRISERLLIATLWIGGGRQVDAVAMRADHPRG